MLALRHLRSGLAAAIIGTSVLPAAGSAERCQSLISEFNQLVDTGTENEAQQLIDKIATSAECGRYQVPAQRRLAALRLKSAQSLMARGRPVADYEYLLIAADAPEVLWQAAATLGEVRFGERQFAQSAQRPGTAFG